jgi:hypothetical protein
MSTPQIRGVTGLLDGILSPARQTATDFHNGSQPKTAVSAGQVATSPVPPPSTPVRRGRPPGNTAAVAQKEKVTVWITSSLIARYRDWTWEARCQISHLVERALADYHEQHRPQQSGGE